MKVFQLKVSGLVFEEKKEPNFVILKFSIYLKLLHFTKPYVCIVFRRSMAVLFITIPTGRPPIFFYLLQDQYTFYLSFKETVVPNLLSVWTWPEIKFFIQRSTLTHLKKSCGVVGSALYPPWKKLVKIGQIEGNLDSPRFIIS